MVVFINVNTVYMENRTAANANKFYEITDNGRSVETRWGKIGTDGSSETIVESADASVRKAAFDKIFKSKACRKKDPYVVIKRNGLVVEQRPQGGSPRKWGFEVETHSRLEVEQVVDLMRERGLQVKSRTKDYFKSDGKQWDVKRDGSCGYEFASPILSGNAGIFDVKLAVDKIREVCETPVNSKCGIHVTVDVSDHSQAEIVRLVVAYMLAQERFFERCNESRQHNHYCQRNPGDPARLLAAARSDCACADKLHYVLTAVDYSNRYHGLNLTRLSTKKIVEFRMLESSVSARKVGSWISTVIGFVDAVKREGAEFFDNHVRGNEIPEQAFSDFTKF
jgi:predicted DNA-binding WGR domain protein